MQVTTEFKPTTDNLSTQGNVDIKVNKVQKDFFSVQVFELPLGIFERSLIRQMIGDFDAEFGDGNYKAVINGFILGVFNKTQIRMMVSKFDNAVE